MGDGGVSPCLIHSNEGHEPARHRREGRFTKRKGALGLETAKWGYLVDALDELRREGLYIRIRTIEAPQDAWLEVEGKRVLNLCSNNYLGLANHPLLKEASIRVIERMGVGPGAVRTIAGTTQLHVLLEEKLAKFKGTESAVLFQSGFTANLATIPALLGEGDVIFSDELNHASIIDGCRLSRAKTVRYPHSDPARLEELLAVHKGHRNLIVTDGVFSMDGDVARLPDLVEIAKRHGAMLMVDDAHGEGVLGNHGRGIVDHFGLTGEVDIEVGTLSKAFGVVGGYVATEGVVAEYLSQKGRPFLFSSSLTLPDVAAAIAAVDILEESDELLQRLWANTRYFKEKMKELGFDTGASETPITPVMIGDANRASEFSGRLFEEGVFAQSISYPTVPVGKARIRVMLSATHSTSDLDYALEKFAKVGRALGVI